MANTALAVVTLAVAGLDVTAVARAVAAADQVPGRMERVHGASAADDDPGPLAVVDYARAAGIDPELALRRAADARAGL